MTTRELVAALVAATPRGSEPAPPRLSLIIPAKDEAQRLPETLRRVAKWRARTNFPLEVVVVDDGSSDGTATAAAAFSRKLPGLVVARHETRRGKGAALRYGAEHCTAPVVAFSDADLSSPIEDLPRLLAAVVEGADVAVGSRRALGGPVAEGRSALRAFTSAVFARLSRAIVDTGVCDTQCGFKAFRRDALMRILADASVDGFAFDVEWLALARLRGLRIVETGVHWKDDPRSTVRLARDVGDMIRDLLVVRRRVAAARARRKTS